MIVFDTSAIAYGMLYQLGDDVDIGLLRHSILNKIGFIIRELAQYKNSTEELILACDSRSNWRKELFPPYKAARKKNREDKKGVDWDQFFEDFNTLIEEFTANMPFKVLKLDRAEADDIIAIICKHRCDNNITIVSPDKDFRQLCKLNKNIKLYSPLAGVGFIDASEYDLFEHVIKGDKEDGVPNVLSAGNVFVEGVRQTTLTAKKKQVLKDYKFNLDNVPFMDDDIKERIDMNTKLIDLNNIPQDLVDATLEQYDNYKVPKGKMFGYFVSKKLTKIMESGLYK